MCFLRGAGNEIPKIVKRSSTFVGCYRWSTGFTHFNMQFRCRNTPDAFFISPTSFETSGAANTKQEHEIFNNLKLAPRLQLGQTRIHFEQCWVMANPLGPKDQVQRDSIRLWGPPEKQYSNYTISRKNTTQPQDIPRLPLTFTETTDSHRKRKPSQIAQEHPSFPVEVQ